MIWIVFIGGVVTGALGIGLIILAHEILEIGSDMDCIRRFEERKHAEALVDEFEVSHMAEECQAAVDETFARYKRWLEIQELESKL